MKVTDADLREALGHHRPRAGPGREGCPSAEAIAAHAEGTGDTGTEAPDSAVLEHIAQCAACAVEYRLALSLKPWAEGAASALAGSPPATRVRPRTTWLPHALAASLLLSLGLAGWNLSLRGQGVALRAQLAETQGREAAARELAERGPERITSTAADVTSAPAVNVPIVDLDAGAARGANGAVTELRATAGAPLLTFVLTVSGRAAAEPHRLEIQSEDSRVVWAGGGLLANRYGTFTLAVPSALLPPGRYRFVLSAPGRDGSLSVAQTYTLVVRPPAP